MRKLKNNELNRLTVSEFKNAKKLPLVIVLDNIRSLNNVGSIFRICDAFLCKKLILCGLTGFPPNREINKTALGATESVEWNYFEKTSDAISKLREENYQIVSVEQVENSVSLSNFSFFNQNYALVFGNEVNGIEQEIIDMSDNVVEIQQLGTKHSLNIAVSAGIVIWEFHSHLKAFR